MSKEHWSMATQPDPGADRASGSPPDEGRVDILIVDDRPDKRLVYQTILEDLGHSLTHHAICLGSLRLLQGIYERRRATLH